MQASTKIAIIASVVITVVVIIVAAVLTVLYFFLWSHSSSVYTAAVATDVPVCSEMAGKVLENNGTAVDAAITAMLCVGAVNSQSSGIGGGGFMVVFDPTNESVYSFNFREMAPAASKPHMFDSNPALAKRGGLAVAVPGELVGMKMVHDRFGRLPWNELFEPVVNISENGFELTEHGAKAINYSNQFLSNNANFRKWFYNSEGELKQAGDTVQRPEYASMLNMIADEGPGIMYNGSLAKEIVDEVTSHGGIMTLQDLASYHAREDAPLKINYSNMEVYAPPVPSGGSSLLFSLNVMELLDLSPESPSVHLTYQHLVETFKYMFAKRSYLGDPYCPACSSESQAILKNEADMISEEYALSTNQSISNSQTYPPPHYYPNDVPPDGGTSHISIIDSTGMAVSVTTTINSYFGAKLITPSGIVLNNQMDDFSTTSSMGIPIPKADMANFPKPKKRPLSSTTPAIVVKDNGAGKVPYLIIGAAGGPRIPTAVTQASLGVMSYDWSLSEAIEEKRLHVKFNSTSSTVFVESGYPSDITSYLTSLGHTVMTDSMISVVQGVMMDSNGNVSAHADSRKMGEAYLISQ